MALGAILVAVALASPSLSDLTEALDRQTMLLSDADELRIASTRLENAIGAKLRDNVRDCDAFTSELGRLAVLGPTWRDAVQASRAQQDRIDRLLVEPTVSPLVSQGHRDRHQSNQADLTEQVREYTVSHAWLDRQVRARIGGCAPQLSVGSAAWSGEDVAWVVAWTGTVCAADGSGGVRAVRLSDPRAIRLDPALACWTQDRCDCVLETVSTGSALGPTPSLGPAP